MDSLIFGAAGGLIAGAILLIAEYLIRRHEKKRDTAHHRIVKFTNEERRITGSIFNYLGPRSSVELMKSELGPPNKKLKEVVGLFSEDNANEHKETTSYVYLFKNAAVKVTSKDADTIDSLTVVANDTDIPFNNLFFVDPDAKDEFLNVATLTPEMLESCRAAEFPGCRDYFAAAQKAIDNPFYVYLTYFCDYSAEGDIAKNPELLVGSVINGICLSSESETASYVFVSDMV